ncbi:DNA-binding response OmpR family regulator [Povalibacter uvarum]|uniref:histidine kinase n=1 Tax=Povalibacter uvarum TaxID=732238 RepID=A0A841HQG6_9GAMM|nr:response regulator [Povalibacter uvarum]MBB6095116.1 DNA-binding response OmpR family regulator [Povalibacter uvarum]
MTAREILILNVDDNEAARYTKNRSLRHAGFTVADAATGYDALRKAEELQPAVVVLDIKLPDISGLEVCAVLKRRWPRIMVLQTSATFTTGDDRSRGLEGGADGYLTQPIEPRELVAAVRALLRLSEVEDKLRRLNETLEQRVDERTRDLAAANEQLRQEISQRKRAEAALVQAQKMEAIGHLTGGIAHDFNNLLTAVVGNLDRIRARAKDSKLVQLAEHAFRAADRGSKLTAQLLAFSRTQKLATQPVNLQELFEGMTDLLRQSLGPTVALTVEVEPDLPQVLADPNQLELAILNLAINSRDAMRGGEGRITVIASRGIRIEALNELPPGEYVNIAVQDNGSGMTPDVVSRAFDPFFTTKPAGKGTGLGLSQVYGIARQAGGTAWIASERGSGTTVNIVLRLTHDTAQKVAPEDVATAQRNSETILVVDDDPDVRALVEDFLSEIGYRVLAAADGDEALRLLDSATPHLVLADFAMPGNNGADVAREIRRRMPDIPILFFSGYADTAALESAVGSTPLLRKPFRPAELAAAVRSLLDGD